MNFETKYLIRWGIPGWTFILSLTPYIVVMYFDRILNIYSQKNLLIIGTFLTLSGVPIGYFFNQMHHFFTWVFLKMFIRDGWNEFFKDEIILDNVLAQEKNKHFRERYRYLLSKKHEVGSVLFSFLGALIIVLINSLSDRMSTFEFLYALGLIILSLCWLALRNYASANIDIYFKELVKASGK